MSLTLLSFATYADERQDSIISVSGFGEIIVDPNKATIHVSVESRKKTQKEARDDVNNVVIKATSVIEKLDIDKKYVNSSRSQIRPEYRYTNNRRVFNNYYVSRQLIIDLRDLEKIGPLMESLLDAGISNVSPPNFSSTELDDLKRKALAIATKDARKNATVIAKSLDVKLGNVKSFNYNNSRHNSRQPSPRYAMAMADSAKSEASETYEVGQIPVSVNVNATFYID